MQYRFNDLAYVYGKPEVEGCLKAQNSDFCVDEIMPVVPSGEGEHLWLKIKKEGSNTDWVAQQLAKYAGIKSSLVSYAGMKDRHAITTQWFSLHLPGLEDPDFSALDDPEFKILQQSRHNRKLKRGALSGNRFQIRITDLCGDMLLLEENLKRIQQQGVPNYFGEQRFGREFGNLYKAEKLFNRELKKVKKLQRGLYISAARSWIFNQLVSTRIQQANWLSPIQGEVYMLNGKSACFVDDNKDENFKRLLDKEINLTACMWGEGESMAVDEVLALERKVAAQFAVFSAGLENARLNQERRAMRLLAENMSWEIKDKVLSLNFDLVAGAFATMVLRECVNLN
ncbi:tRNA pseudouridine(13) synthase [hydrothermal vent metagenome]|uniref:tRNA pseudouridine(13) synthase n=1 Tax=hydrothermal vent metagenome TaxID=652676 RepID=A0A3B0Y0Y9_9ZZZZ